MVATIKIMPEWLANQIAAGEVVERPAAVVKELVENSLDAGASRVTVEIGGGGKALIRVVDNGAGMSREDALLSLDRHATSKCVSIDDLRRIHTFGFRGEALPSIASVSRFRLRTNRRDEPAGTEVHLAQSGERVASDDAMAPGTEIIVEDLFHNVPARRKFLKSDASENKAVVETVQRLALSNHKVHFELIVDGKTLLNTPAESNRLARVFAILGRKVCENLYECFIDGPVAVAGFISQPAIRKRDSHGLFTFVNGRFVRDRLIMQAVSNAYATLLGRGEYPYAVIDVNVPAEEVDVNVHPTKSEVRFERPSEVFAAVSRAVRLTLSEAPWVRQELAGPAPEATGSTPPFDSLPLTQGRPPSAPPEGRGAGLWGSAEAAGSTLPLDSLPLAQGRPPAPPPEGRAAGQRGSAEAARGQFGRMVYLGQFANCYLVGQTGDRLVIVDQHAAHERVMFEALKKEFEERKVASQPLLVPRLVELDPALVAAVEARQETLERLGFSVEPFGGHEVAIKSVPVLLRQRDPAPAVRAVLDELADLEDLSLATLFHKPISTMACHMAVRAGDPMEREEAVELFRLMDRVDLSAYCPHGRPVVVLFDEVEVGRWFKRT